MRNTRTLAVAALALLLAGSLAGPRPSLAHSAHDLPPSGYIFAGLADGHIYRSADGGSTWEEADAGLSATRIQSLAVAPDGTTVYAGTSRNGLWSSADDGTSWQAADGSGVGAIPQGAPVNNVAIDPLDSHHLFAVSYGGYFYESTDGGQRWSARTLPQGDEEVMALDPQRPSTLLVGTYDKGALVSTDGGGTWTLALGMPDWVKSLAFDPRHPDLAYAAAWDGLYRSADGGRSWRKQDLPFDDFIESGAVAVDPSGLARVLVGSARDEIARSRDGLAWRSASVPAQPGADGIYAIAFDPARPARVLAGTLNYGLLVSTDSGGSWQLAPNPSGTQGGYENGVLCMATTPRIPLPSDPVDPPSDLAHARYFAITSHTLREPFLSFWDRHGNGPLFGSPLTEAFTEDGQRVQYFERARLVYSGGLVAVSPLGLTVTAGRHFPPVTPSTSSASRLYFPSTGHTLAAPFLAYWQAHEGSTLIGPPISQPLYEQNGDGTGRSYLVQYFKNMRLEYHPELAGTPYTVSPGLIGREYLHQRGWI